MTDAKDYARAIFELSQEEGKCEETIKAIELICEALEKNSGYTALLDSPALSKDERLSLISEAFGSLDEYSVNLLKILCEKHSVHLFKKIAAEVSALYDEARGIERVEAITAISMTEAQKEALTKKLEAITGKTVILDNKVDPTLLGGVVLRYSGIQLDGSIKHRFDELRKSLSNIVM